MNDQGILACLTLAAPEDDRGYDPSEIFKRTVKIILWGKGGKRGDKQRGTINLYLNTKKIGNGSFSKTARSTKFRSYQTEPASMKRCYKETSFLWGGKMGGVGSFDTMNRHSTKISIS